MKKLLFISILIVSNIYAETSKVIASCANTKSELVDLKKIDTKGFKDDSLSVDIILRDKKAYLISNSSSTELFFIGGNQFLEKVAAGHSVLYTYFENKKILTIQKSYDLFGPIMVNMILKCK